MRMSNNEIDLLFILEHYRDITIKDMDFLLKEESEIINNIKDAYNNEEKKKFYPEISRDFFVRIPSEWYGEWHSKNADTWIYRFNYENLFLKLTRLHSVHTLDIIFAFKNFKNLVGKTIFSLTPWKKKAFDLAERLQNDFVGFVKSGKCEWDTFINRKCVKIYQEDSDIIENSENDIIRKLWKETNVYKNI